MRRAIPARFFGGTAPLATYLVTSVDGAGGVLTFQTVTQGSGYAAGTVATTTSGAGLGFTAVVTLTGAGYAVGDTGTVDGGANDATYTVTSVDANGFVTGYTITFGGYGYQVGQQAGTSATSGSGTGFTLQITMTGWTALLTVDVPAGSAGTNYVQSACFLQGYIIATIGSLADPLRRQFFVSNQNDPTTFNPSEFGTKQANPDPMVAAYAANELLLLMGSNTIELWEDAGALNFQFQLIQGGGVIYTGLASRDTVSTMGDTTVCWLGADARGRLIAWQLQGRSPVRISNHAIEAQWALFDATGACAYPAQFNGHWFWIISFPIADVTFVYDIVTGVWAQWLAYDGANFHCDLARYHASAWGVAHVGLDYNNGNIYMLQIGLGTDNGAPIQQIRRSPIVSSEGKRLLIQKFRLVQETGGADTSPVALRVSHDAGHTWGNYLTLPVGALGLYQFVVELYRLGKGRYNAIEISTSNRSASGMAIANASWVRPDGDGSSATPVISFNVPRPLENYGDLTIEGLTVSPFPTSASSQPFASPPLEQPVTGSPSAALTTPASSQQLATSLMDEQCGRFMRETRAA